MKFVLIAVVLMGLWSHAARSAALEKETNCVGLPPPVEAAISRHTTVVHGAERCELRKVARGQLDRDGSSDLAVAYTIEGACNDRPGTPVSCGDSFSVHIAAFLGRGEGFDPTPFVTVADNGQRRVADVRIVDGRIEVDTLDFAASDALCCPSRPGHASLALENGMLHMIPSLEMIARMLESGGKSERRDAIQMLKMFDDPEAIRLLERALREGTDGERRAAAQGLVNQKDQEQVQRLLNMLSDRDVSVRMEAISALGDLRAEEAVEPLLGAYSHSFLRGEVVSALAKIGPASLQKVLPLVGSSDPRKRSAAKAISQALAHSLKDDMIGPLVGALAGANQCVGCVAPHQRTDCET